MAEQVKPQVAFIFGYDFLMQRTQRCPEKVLAENLIRLMGNSIGLNSEAKVAKAGKLGQRTVNRAKNGKQVKLESLKGLAAAFDLSPWQLLVPDLDPNNPPILAMTDDEKALYKRLQSAAKAFSVR